MAEFMDVIRHAKRMCGSFGDRCVACPFRKDNYACAYAHLTDDDATPEDAESFERTVMEWAKENPEPVYPSWDEAWKQLFPNAMANWVPCARHFVPPERIAEFCGSQPNCIQCRKRPIPAEVATRLGIKPIQQPFF